MSERVPCCLCFVSVEEDHRKRRKLHGRSCEVARAVLLKMSRFALRYSETQDLNAVLCLTCDKLLRDFMTTEKKLELLRAKVTEKLERLERSSIRCEPQSNSKRPRYDHSMMVLHPGQLSTDIQLPLEAQEDVVNVPNLQYSRSSEHVIDMEASEGIVKQSNPLSTLSQSSAGCQLTPGQSPPVKVSFQITMF